jgi:aminoglycoside phosphotransferase (APT) family kinase protein
MRPKSAHRSGEVPGIDGGAVSAWIAGRVAGIGGPLSFTAVGNGRSNLTYLAEDGDRAAVIVRRPPLGEALESAHDVGREYAALGALHPLGLPVPEPLALCEDRTVTGAPFYVMERIEGRLVDTAAAAEAFGRAARGRAGREIPATLARLHEVDLQRTGLAAMAPAEDHAGRQLRRWSRQWEASRTRELPLIDEVAERLGAAVPGQPETTIVHGDFTPNNLLMDADGEVAAILDWELWTLGDPVADLAWLGIWWPPDAARAPLGAAPPSAVDGAPSAAELARTYAERSDLDLDRLPFWTALSYWKLAIILEGVFRRWREDPANGGESAGEILPRADAMAQLALEALEDQ